MPRTCASASRTAAATTLRAGFGVPEGLGVGAGGEGVVVGAASSAGGWSRLEPVTKAVRAMVPPTTPRAPAAPTATLAQAGRVEKFMTTRLGRVCKTGPQEPVNLL